MPAFMVALAMAILYLCKWHQQGQLPEWRQLYMKVNAFSAKSPKINPKIQKKLTVTSPNGGGSFWCIFSTNLGTFSIYFHPRTGK